MQTTKTCPRCKEVKEYSLFAKNKAKDDGLSTYCKACRSETRRARYISKKRPIKQCVICGDNFLPKNDRQVNCSKKSCSDKVYREKNLEKLRASSRERSKEVYQKRKKEVSLYYKKRYQENKEAILARNKKWRDNNPEKRTYAYNKEYRQEYYKKRWANDMNFRLVSNLRGRLHEFPHRSRSKSIRQLLGCSLDEFRTHMEELFVDGMTWENYGEWHIDHILPCDVFELQNSEEVEVCFHFTNLQPLWAGENITKSNNLI